MIAPVCCPTRSASTIRDIVANRSSAFLASMRITATSSHGGTSARSFETTTGASLTWRASTSNTRPPTNGAWPVSISYATQPSW